MPINPKSVLASCILSMLVLTGCARDTFPIYAPPSMAKIDPGLTYGLITLEDRNAQFDGFTTHSFCKLGPNGEYTVRASGWLLCDSITTTVLLGQISAFDEDQRKVFELSDGTLVKFVRLRQQLRLGWTAPNPGPYALVGRVIGQGRGLRNEVPSDRVDVYDIQPLAIHYFGHVTGRNIVKWRDPGDLTQKILAEFPGLEAARIQTGAPKPHDIRCIIEDRATYKGTTLGPTELSCVATLI